MGQGCIEKPGYYNLGKSQIYYFHLIPKVEALGKVLLAGPFVSERPLTYSMWVKWARYLNQNNLEVLLFDYRGTGESTDEFEDICPDIWLEDLETMANWLNSEKNNNLIIHGFGLGGLLASIAFDKGIGDGLLTWSPTQSLNKMLYAALRQRCASDLIIDSEGPRKTRLDYIKDLENGKNVEVEGFLWSNQLWQKSFSYNYIKPLNDDRPWKSVELGKDAGPLYLKRLFAPPNPSADSKLYELNPNLNHIFKPNLNWITDSFR